MITESLPTSSMYNLNKRVTDVLHKDTLSGKRCFILAGGPSIEHLDMTMFNNEYTIGINRMFERYQAHINYFMDEELYRRIINRQLDTQSNSNVFEKFISYRGIKVFLALSAEIIYKHDCYVVNRIYDEVLSTNIREGIYAGSNSGYGSINLAVSMGCKDIYLVGYDMKAVNKTHYHDGYSGQKMDEFKATLQRFKTEFYKDSHRWITNGIQITNCVVDSEDSTDLKCFNIKKLKDII